MECKISGAFKRLCADDIPMILRYAGSSTDEDTLAKAFKRGSTIGVAVKYNKEVSVILVMMCGAKGYYVVLLWTDGKFRSIKESMGYLRSMAKETMVLFHSKNQVAKNHRKTIRIKNREYYQAVA